MTEKLYYPVDNTDKFVLADQLSPMQEIVDEYNGLMQDNESNMIALKTIIYKMLRYASGSSDLYEFALVMIILKLALVKRNFNAGEWLDGARIAYKMGELEICRELLYDSSVGLGIKTVKNDNRDFGAILQETKEQNAADILGMIVEELEADGLGEDDYEQILKEFAKSLELWRNIETPKINHNKEICYDLCMR